MAVGDRKARGLSTVQDYWNAIYRGLVPGGTQWAGPPEYMDLGPDPEPFDEDNEEQFVPPAPPPHLPDSALAVPVTLIDDLSRTGTRVETFAIMGTMNVGAVSSTLIVPRNSFRVQTVIQNLGPGTIYLGHNESVGTGGFAIPSTTLSASVGPTGPFILFTTREIWAIQQTGQATVGQVSILQEYAKDTAS